MYREIAATARPPSSVSRAGRPQPCGDCRQLAATADPLCALPPPPAAHSRLPVHLAFLEAIPPGAKLRKKHTKVHRRNRHRRRRRWRQRNRQRHRHRLRHPLPLSLKSSGMANLGFARWAVTPAERAIAIGVAHAELRALLWYRNADRLLESTGGTVPDWVRNVRRRLEAQVGAVRWIRT